VKLKKIEKYLNQLNINHSKMTLIKENKEMYKCPNCGEPLLHINIKKVIKRIWGSKIYYADDYYDKCTNCEYKSTIKRSLTKVGQYYQLPFYKRIFMNVPKNNPPLY
jgi:ssDNA-binding Zn-finger/Zn-ribbon topoisomerase 1